MGWNIDRFLDKENIVKDLICSICTDVVKAPVQTNCEHTFCKVCINRWMEEGRRICPEDREPISSGALKSPNRMRKQILNNLIVRCKYYGEGCCLMAKLEYMPQLIEHEVNQCQLHKTVPKQHVLIT